MTNSPTKKIRESADEFLERHAGDEFSTALLVAELESAAYGAYETFRYHPEDVPEEWLAAVKLISESNLRIFGEEREEDD